MKEILPDIDIDPDIRGGKPVISGTRVPVELVLGKLAGGATYGEIKKEYELTQDQILAALRYAAHIASDEQVKAIL
ncbi:MAG: DUF433 domain-containing protein [Thermacetogeniaceae bacterium]|jgi:uncharacterized protein (DUF433 family)